MVFDSDLSAIFGSKKNTEVLKFFMKHPSDMSEREIARVLKMSHMSVNRAVKLLEKTGLISGKNIGESNVWVVRKNSYAYSMFQSLEPVFDYKKAVMKHLFSLIKKRFKPVKVKKAVLYGSMAEGTEREGSDIDVFIMVESQEEKKKAESIAEDIAVEGLDLYGNVIEINVKTENEFKRLSNKELVKNINRGVEIL